MVNWGWGKVGKSMRRTSRTTRKYISLLRSIKGSLTDRKSGEDEDEIYAELFFC